MPKYSSGRNSRAGLEARHVVVQVRGFEISVKRQASIRRLEEFKISPLRDLGQNFLVDDNLLGVIARESYLTANDVVLEIGGGLGVLSEYLAQRAAFVHVYEIDMRLRPALEQALRGSAANTALHMEDAIGAALDQLQPAANKVISNLPYSVATPLIIQSIYQLPTVDCWCLMVQREIADRLAAAPGGKQYGAPSVLVQLVCDVEFLRPVASTVFVPEPKIESALIRLSRVRPLVSDRVRALVRAAFAHRRKTLAGSVALAAKSGQLQTAFFDLSPKQLRSACMVGLISIGQPQNQRAEQLCPQDFAKLAEEIAE